MANTQGLKTFQTGLQHKYALGTSSIVLLSHWCEWSQGQNAGRTAEGSSLAHMKRFQAMEASIITIYDYEKWNRNIEKQKPSTSKNQLIKDESWINVGTTKTIQRRIDSFSARLNLMNNHTIHAKNQMCISSYARNVWTGSHSHADICSSLLFLFYSMSPGANSHVMVA